MSMRELRDLCPLHLYKGLSHHVLLKISKCFQNNSALSQNVFCNKSICIHPLTNSIIQSFQHSAGLAVECLVSLK